MGVKTGVKKMSHFGEECDMIWAEVINARCIGDTWVFLVRLAFLFKGGRICY